MYSTIRPPVECVLLLKNVFSYHLGIAESKEEGLMDKEVLARRVMAARALRQRQSVKGVCVCVCVCAAYLKLLAH